MSEKQPTMQERVQARIRSLISERPSYISSAETMEEKMKRINEIRTGNFR